MRRLIAAASAALVLACAGSASAASVFYWGSLTTSSALDNQTGSVEIITGETALRATWRFRSLKAPATAGFLFCCEGVMGGPNPLAFSFGALPGGDPIENAQGEIRYWGMHSQIYDMTNAGSYAPTFLAGFGGDTAAAWASIQAALVNREVSFAIGTNLAPTGAISGYVAVPEPATWAMMIIGFGLAGTAIRTRRRPRLAPMQS